MAEYSMSPKRTTMYQSFFTEQVFRTERETMKHDLDAAIKIVRDAEPTALFTTIVNEEDNAFSKAIRYISGFLVLARINGVYFENTGEGN
jgi:hypothetical protein